MSFEKGSTIYMNHCNVWETNYSVGWHEWRREGGKME